MEIDPATICARTGAGEAELAQARSGLTLPQRKALSLLAAPRVYAEFAAENNLDPERLGRDFSRLAELGLITLQLGSVVVIPPVRPRVDAAPVHAAPAPRPKVKPAPIPTDARLRPVVIGAAPGRSPLRVGLLTGVVVAAVGAGWFALRAGARPEAVASSTPLTMPAASTVPIIAATPGSAPPEASAPAAALPRVAVAPAVQPPRVAPPERLTLSRATASTANSASARASDVKLAVAAAVPAHASASGSPVVERTPGRAGEAPERVTETAVSPPVPPPPAAAAPVPSPAVSALQAASAAPVSSPAAPALPVASAAKPSVAASPSAKTALQPIAREAPEFPREAIAEGVASGTVKARVTLDGSGKVTGIEILDAQPRRVFDRAVRAALWRWQYEPGAPNRTADVEVAFARQ